MIQVCMASKQRHREINTNLVGLPNPMLSSYRAKHNTNYTQNNYLLLHLQAYSYIKYDMK